MDASPWLSSVTWLHTHSPQPQGTELQLAHDPQEENLSDEDPMFACRITFNPREHGGSPYKTAVQPAWQGRANQRARMQSPGRWPLLLTGSTVVACAAELQLEPACASMPDTDVAGGKAEGTKPQQTSLQQLGLIAQSLQV